MTKGQHYELHCEQQRSQFTVMNDIVNDKNVQDIVNDSLAHKPDGLLVWINNSNLYSFT